MKSKNLPLVILDFSNLKITVDVSKLPPLIPRHLTLQNIPNKKFKNIRAQDPDAEKKFMNLLKNDMLTFNTLGNFKIIVKENINKLDINVSDKNNTFHFKEVDMLWLGCGKDYDYYDDMSYPEHLGNSVLLIKNKTCISISTDIRQFSLQRGEKVIRYISTVDTTEILRSSGFIQTNFGYYALSSFNNRDGFLPKQFISSSSHNDEYRFKLLRWTNTYPYGQVKKIKVEILSKTSKTSNIHLKKDNSTLKKWFGIYS